MVEVTVYGAAWCPETRRCKRLLGEARVDYVWVDVDDDPDGEAFVRRQDSGKLTLPVVVLRDGPVLVAPGGPELFAALGVEPPKDLRYFDLIVAGAGPAGLSAALLAVREGIRCLVLEPGEPGGQAAEAPALLGSPGFTEGIAGGDVAETLRAQAKRFGVRMLGLALTGLRRSGDYVVVTAGSGDEFRARAVIVATGAVYAQLGIPGEDELRGAGVHFSASSDGPFYRKSEELMVVGGGDLAGEEALILTGFTQKVRMLEPTAEFRASPLLLERLRRNPKIELYPSSELTELTISEDGKLAAAVVRDRTTGYTFSFNPPAVFIYAGMTPNTEPFGRALELDDAGFILVDRSMQTSMPGVFAAGDVRAASSKQLGAAIGEGLAAAMMARRHLETFGDLSPRASA